MEVVYQRKKEHMLLIKQIIPLNINKYVIKWKVIPKEKIYLLAQIHF